MHHLNECAKFASLTCVTVPGLHCICITPMGRPKRKKDDEWDIGPSFNSLLTLILICHLQMVVHHQLNSMVEK